MNSKTSRTILAMMFLTLVVINHANAQSVCIVINSGFSKSSLDNIHNILEGQHIDASFEDTRYDGNKLLHAKMKINIPQKFSREYTTDISDSKPLMFYFEDGKGDFLKDIPATLSSKSKPILSNNLTGLLILFERDRMLAYGSFQTTWK